MSARRPAICSLLTGLSLAATAGAQQSDSGIETIEVIGRAPLSLRQSVEGVASNVQAATSEQIADQHALDFADFIKRNLASVFVNEAQNNPLQPDVQYRGFVGSPLLGLPQGIAVYQDAVRINEPFGDTVNWALIPESAIDTAFLMPGSNPLYGLNALGGAIAIETKDGFSHPGSSVELSAGSFGRASVQAQTGAAASDELSYFATAAYLDEDGWRDFSPTEALQAFGKLSWRGPQSSLDLSLTYADTDLIGNGAAPLDLLAMDRSAIFTRPDRTENSLTQLNVVGQRDLTDNILLTGNVYARQSDIDSLNGDDSNYQECDDASGLLCIEEDGVSEPAFDVEGDPIPADDTTEGATINRTYTRQDVLGFGMQANWFGEWRGKGNQLIVGLAYDRADVDFDSNTELGALDATRLAIPGGVFVGDSFTALAAESTNLGIYISNALRISDRLSLTASARYNRVDVTLRDQLGTALDGDHRFSRVNPAIGLSYRISSGLTFYVSYSESNRVPSPVELTCADEDDPCRLPNAFLADPPLEQVVAETLEVGARGIADAWSWNVGMFKTVNKDDVLFISAGGLTNEGFFDNVGRTRRNGVELSIDGVLGDSAQWFAHYTHLDATFESSFLVQSVNNPYSTDGEIAVSKGDRIPLVPSGLLKLGLRVPLGARFTVGADMLASSGQYLRGDEGNFASKIDGYTVVNLRADFRLNEQITFFAAAENVLDEDYETFGVFGDAREVLGPQLDSRRFLSPAAPRAAWLGVQFDF
jgi:iron complex outermembrane receptor protein